MIAILVIQRLFLINNLIEGIFIQIFINEYILIHPPFHCNESGHAENRLKHNQANLDGRNKNIKEGFWRGGSAIGSKLLPKRLFINN